MTWSTSEPTVPVHRPARKRWLAPGALLLLLAAGGAFRWEVVGSWHAPAGDGVHYYRLAQQLVRDGRFAFGPPPAPLTYSRLPGYSLLLARVIVRKEMSLDLHLINATRFNVFLDLCTALLTFLLFLELRLGGRLRALAGAAGVLAAPLMLLLSCYGLTETLATCLGTLELYLAVRAMRTRPLFHAALAGLVAGCAQLVRVDAVTVAPAVGLCLLYAKFPRRQRLHAAAGFAIAAALVFAPWPVRNLVRFGAAHPAATFWRDFDDGEPLPDAPIQWERTWGSGAVGESQLDMFFVFRHELAFDGEGVLQPAMYDSPEERERVLALFARYASEGWTPAVTGEFAQLASERAWHHPVRTFVTLPVRRIWKLWSPVPEEELPMRTDMLDLPAKRAFFGQFDGWLYAFALIGAIALFVEKRRLVLALLGSVVVFRSLIYGFTAPIGVTARYLVEVEPLLILLAAFAVVVVIPRIASYLTLRVAPRRGRRAAFRAVSDESIDLSSTDETVILASATAARTFNLPAAHSPGQRLTVINASNEVLTLRGNGGRIDGSTDDATLPPLTPGAPNARTIMSDGKDWWTVQRS